ncbi:MAG: outer membrane lipoprotein chaperone LolA, partial [Desulfobacteraceae bacterium]|nr:outer membrane lipoprotein chaperone LolA [Desulfobacteraceae bacterium]
MKSSIIHSFSRLMLCLLLFAALFASPLEADDTLGEETLTAIEKLYTGKGFQADFSQISKLAALEITETASGKAWFNHPGKMKWLYLKPQRHEIITDGQTLWIYRPDQDQVMKGDAQKFFKAGAGSAFLSDIGLMRKNFTMEVKETNDTHLSFLLTAKQKNPDLVSILIRVSRTTHVIQQVTTRNAYGDTTLFEFTNIQFKQMDASIFEFKIPEGSSII